MLSLKVMGISGNPSLINYEFARQKGFFDAQGVNPEITSGQSDIVLLQGVQAGEINLAAGGGGAPFAAMTKGAPLKVVGNCFERIAHAFYARPGINSPNELKGKSLGIAALGTFIHMISVAWLKAKGIDPKQVEFIQIGANTHVFQAILAGKVDGGVAGVELLPLAKRQGVPVLADSLGEDMPNFVAHVFYTRAVDVNDSSKREAMIRFLTGVAQGKRALYDAKNKDAYVKVAVDLQKREPDDAAAFYDWAVRNKLFSTNLQTRPEQIKTVQELNVEFEQQAEILPFEKVTDMTLHQEVMKRIGEFK